MARCPEHRARRNTIRCVFGRKGTGKSYGVKRLVEQRGRAVLVWDPMSEWAGPGASDPPAGAVPWASLDALLEELAAGRAVGRIVAVQAPFPEFGRFCRLAQRCGDVLVVVDEVQLQAKPQRVAPELLELTRLGRHTRVDQIYIARRPAEVHRDLTAMADVLQFYRTHEPRDLEWVSLCCGSEFASRLPKLPRWGSLEWTGHEPDRLDPPRGARAARAPRT